VWEKLGDDDTLHIVGHGTEDDAGVITLGKIAGNMDVRDLADAVTKFTDPSLKLIVLDMCFGFGQYELDGTWKDVKIRFPYYFKKNAERSFVAKLLAEQLGEDYKDLWVRGSANAVVYPNPMNLSDGVRPDLYTSHPKDGWAGGPGGRSVLEPSLQKYIYERIMYEVNGKGEMRLAGGPSVTQPANLVSVNPVVEQKPMSKVTTPRLGGSATTSAPIGVGSKKGKHCPNKPANKYSATSRWCNCCSPSKQLVEDS
jgi:hypothetical protein